MSFIYPRRLTIFRWQSDLTPSNPGIQPYQEPQTINPSTEIWQTPPVFTNISCSIQEYRSGTRPVDNLPGSSYVTPTSKIFIPRNQLSLGQVVVRDFLMDDLGIQYQVVNPYWNSLGYRLYTIYLQL